jgi:hypothetical protein
MPLDPPFETDSQPWWQIGPPLRITVHPAAPPNGAPGNPAGTDGIDDWIVPPSPHTGTSYPDDRIYPDDWFVPTPSAAPSTASPASSPQPNPAGPGISGRPAARPDPFAAYWSLIPASRAGAMAWHPPIFPPPNPFSPENIPASAWVTPLPIFLNSLGQFPSTAPQPPDLPPIPASHGLLGGIAKLLAASTPPDVPEIGPEQGLLGAIARLPDASTPPNVPAIVTLGTTCSAP